VTRKLILAGLLIAAAAWPVRAQGTPSDTLRSTSGASARFTLEPGDVVQTTIWREKDMNGKFTVDEAGRLTLPMIGTVNVLGRPWDELRDSLLTEYAHQLKNPSVILTPLRRVQVLGEVTKPGQYFADPTTSLAGVVALAGGATPDGDLHRVRVVHNGQVVVKTTTVENLLLQGVHSNDQVFVDRRPWVERNAAIVASTMISAAGILVTILHR
jgi:polysaccharide export outer membrane protein